MNDAEGVYEILFRTGKNTLESQIEEVNHGRKKGFSKKLNAFFAGKGFYIVLLLCAVLVGASFWLVGRGSGADVERDPVKETNIPASAQETAPPQGSIPVMNTEEDERLPLGTGVLPAAEGEEMPEA